MALTASRMVPYAVIKMTGISGSDCTAAFRTSWPSARGSLKSVSTMAKAPRRIFSSAARPSGASSTPYPSASSVLRSTERRLSLSSTIRIRSAALTGPPLSPALRFAPEAGLELDEMALGLLEVGLEGLDLGVHLVEELFRLELRVVRAVVVGLGRRHADERVGDGEPLLPEVVETRLDPGHAVARVLDLLRPQLLPRLAILEGLEWILGGGPGDHQGRADQRGVLARSGAGGGRFGLPHDSRRRRPGGGGGPGSARSLSRLIGRLLLGGRRGLAEALQVVVGEAQRGLRGRLGAGRRLRPGRRGGGRPGLRLRLLRLRLRRLLLGLLLVLVLLFLVRARGRRGGGSPLFRGRRGLGPRFDGGKEDQDETQGAGRERSARALAGAPAGRSERDSRR